MNSEGKKQGPSRRGLILKLYQDPSRGFFIDLWEVQESHLLYTTPFWVLFSELLRSWKDDTTSPRRTRDVTSAHLTCPSLHSWSCFARSSDISSKLGGVSSGPLNSLNYPSRTKPKPGRKRRKQHVANGARPAFVDTEPGHILFVLSRVPGPSWDPRSTTPLLVMVVSGHPNISIISQTP